MTRTTRAFLAALATAAAAAGGLADEGGGYRTIVLPGDFPTIQAAIDAADGSDLIVVRGGTWHESLVVSGGRRAGLQIYANDGATLVSTSGTAAISVTTSSVGVHGFVVQSSGDGVVVSNAAGVNVDGTYVKDAGGDAFRVVGSRFVQLNSNVVDVAGDAGFRVTGSSAVTILANEVGGAADGVVVSGSSSVSVCSNSFDGLDRTAVTAADSRELVIDENYVRDVGDTGFDVADTAGVYLGGNTIVDDGGASPLTGDGIRVVGSTGVDLSANTVEGALGHGVVVDAPGAEVWMTAVSGVGGDAIRLGERSAGAHVSDGTVGSAGGSGIVVLADGVTVLGNRVQDVGGDGVQVRGDAAYVGANSVESAGRDGLSVTSTPGDDGGVPTVENNQAWGSGRDGLDLGATCGARVTGNLAQRSGVHGIELGAGDTNFLHKNRANKNRKFDLFEDDAAKANVIDKTNKFKRAHRRGGAGKKHPKHQH